MSPTTGDFHVADLCRMKHFDFVSLEAMTLWVEQLGLVPKGSWEHRKESGFAPRKAEAMLGLPSHPIDDSIVPERYRLLSVHAYQRDEIGDSDLAHSLRCDVVTAREEAERMRTSGEIEPSGEERTVRMDFPWPDHPADRGANCRPKAEASRVPHWHRSATDARMSVGLAPLG